MGSLKLGRKVLCFLLLFVLFFQMFSVSLAQTVSAEGSNSRVQANIQWGQKKSFQDMSADDLGQLTYDDLRMIGVFLSNFYVPYSTAVGKSTSEDTVKEDMVNALVNQCNFNKDVASALVPMVWQMVLDTAKPLNIGKINGNDEVMTGDIEISDDKLEYKVEKDKDDASIIGIEKSTDFYMLMNCMKLILNSNQYNDFTNQINDEINALSKKLKSIRIQTILEIMGFPMNK